MVSINYATREVSCKIVFYGPGLSGKTTNLQYVHQKVPGNTKGKLISLATDADRTLYFDFLPINIGTINGFASKFQLYTVPGQVYYNATRKLVLRGVDGLVFVADSQPDKMDENIESLNNLKENLAEYGYKVDELPIVIQYNKQDLPNVLSPDEMRQVLNPTGWPEFRASATEGFGVFDTLKCILKLVLEKAKVGGTNPSASPKPENAVAPAASQAEPTSDTARDGIPTQTPVETPVSEPTVPSPEPVTPMAPAAQHSSTPSSQDHVVATASAQPRVSAPAENTSKFQREPVSEVPKTPPAPQPTYRPFPGNTAEDEQSMTSVSQQDLSSTQAPSGSTSDSDFSSPGDEQNKGTNTSFTTGSPHMAPSLKAERPRKKRSFFKRLFGLK